MLVDAFHVSSFYEGSSPILVVADAEIAREILVKHFGDFHGRKTYPLQGSPDSEPEVSV